MANVIGIDPSLTGLAVCRWKTTDLETPEYPEVRVFTSKPAEGLKARIERYGDLTYRAMCTIPNSSTILIEGYSFGSKGNAGRWLAEFGGIFRKALLNIPGADVIEVPPTLLKRFATGKGNAKKEQVVAHVAKRWGAIYDTNDEVDAYVLSLMGLCYAGLREPETEWQREAIDRLKSPKPKKTRKVQLQD